VYVHDRKVSPKSEAATDKKWATFYGMAQVRVKYNKVLRVLPNVLFAFTHGMQWHKNRLVESTGMSMGIRWCEYGIQKMVRSNKKPK
jgi:glutamine cyclotransferase